METTAITKGPNCGAIAANTPLARAARPKSLTLTFAALAATIVLAAALPARAGGVLMAIDAQGHEQTFPLTRTDVQAEVDGPLASVEVTQHFDNPYNQRIEAVYTFPLSHRGAVDDMEMRIGTRVVRSIVRPRGEARQIYDTARTQGRRAALL